MFQSISGFRFALLLTLVAAASAIEGCDSSSDPAAPVPSPPTRYTIGGTVTGLDSGQTVMLSNNEVAELTVSANGAFTFPAALVADASYKVTVAQQPVGEICTVSNSSGSGVTANVSNLNIVCSAETLTISGTVSGLPSGQQVVVKDNGADATTVAANGSFRFSTPIAYDGSYLVTVTMQPSGETCTVTNGAGAGVTADVTKVAVTCSPTTYTIGGTISGLASGAQVTLDDNGADPLTVTANGPFTFAAAVAAQGSYNVTVGTQPVGQTCTVSNEHGTGLSNNVSNVSVTCSTQSFTIGGNVSGLTSGAQVTLDNNGSDPVIVTANGAFVFSATVAYDGSYGVTVGTQPTGEYCSVTGGSGTLVTANVGTVSVSCAPNVVSFSTPGNYTWTVPAGVTSLQIVAIGGGGGGGGMYGIFPSQPGGAGAVVTSTLAVGGEQVITITVGGGGGAGANGTPYPNNQYICGAGGGGGGSSSVDAGSSTAQIIAGGGGGGGGCNDATAGADAGGAGGAGGTATSVFGGTGGGGGNGGVGGAAGNDGMGDLGTSGNSGSGGAGGMGGSNGGGFPGGAGGSSVGTGTGGSGQNDLSGGGGGGYGGGGSGVEMSGGGGGGSVGPAATTYAPGSNAGAEAAAGGDGSVTITLQ